VEIHLPKAVLPEYIFISGGLRRDVGTDRIQEVTVMDTEDADVLIIARKFSSQLMVLRRGPLVGSSSTRMSGFRTGWRAIPVLSGRRRYLS